MEFDTSKLSFVISKMNARTRKIFMFLMQVHGGDLIPTQPETRRHQKGGIYIVLYHSSHYLFFRWYKIYLVAYIYIYIYILLLTIILLSSNITSIICYTMCIHPSYEFIYIYIYIIYIYIYIGYDCGVFTCIFVDFLSTDTALVFTQHHINQCREQLHFLLWQKR